MSIYATGLGDDLTQGQIITAANAALSSTMREKMKPADVTYAQSLIRTSSQRDISDTELRWLRQFTTWYDAYNPKFWNWWEAGGDVETRTLQAAQRATAPQSGTQARPKPNNVPKTPEEKAKQTTSTATDPLISAHPKPSADGNGTRKAMLYAGWAVLAVFGYFVYKSFKSK